VSAKYAFIAGEEGNYPIYKMCVWAKVSRAGFYEWRNRAPSATAVRRERLAALVKFAFEHSDGTSGYRRIHAQLRRWGHYYDDETIRSVMRELGLVACQPRPFRPITTIAGDASAVPDLVRRDFTATAPGCKLVGDITYIPTWEGWLYLATVLDCFSKKVVGYAMADHMRVRRSVGRTGVCYDNAWAESFNGTLKNERVNRTSYPTREHARIDITRYIELRYNQIRLHSALGYMTPNEVECEWFENHRAA